VNANNKIANKMMQKGLETYKKASCHPFMKKEVVPRVEFIWNIFPFDVLCCGCLWGPWMNLILLPGCWCFFVPFWIGFAIPWNLFWISVFIFPLLCAFFVIFGPWIFTALFCY